MLPTAASKKRKEPLSEGGHEDAKIIKEETRLLKIAQKEVCEMETISKANRERFEEISSRRVANECCSLFTPADVKPTVADVDELDLSVFTPGTFVEVQSYTSPGMNREKGLGFIREMIEVGDGTVLATVVYQIDGSVHSGIPLDDLTEMDYHANFFKKSRSKRYAQKEKNEEKEIDSSRAGRSSIDILLQLLKEGSSKKKRKGWRRRQLNLNEKVEGKTKRSPRYNLHEIYQLIYDYDILASFLQGAKTNLHEEKRRDGKFKKRKNKRNPESLTYLLFSWGASFDTVTRCRKKLHESAINSGLTGLAAKSTAVFLNSEATTKSNNVIDCMDAARKLFTAEYLFTRIKLKKCERQINVNDTRIKEVRKLAKAEYLNLNTTEKQLWEAASWAHIERHPRVSDIIRDVVRKNPAISYHGIAAALDYWCSASTIQRWITSREGFKLYTERVIPLLSKEQAQKHLAFAVRLNSNWGQGPGKYLLIHYDETWFWGMLMRKTAKTFEGVDRKAMKIYHKCHVSKTMGIAVVGMAFEDSLENGGVALKMLFHRAQSAKVAQRLTKNKKGEILRKKGDVYFVDCNVTGSSEGSSKDPKFPLMDYFQHALFPEIENLVRPGGRFFGYTPVIQGDNAGPHRDAKFMNFVRSHCSSKGWL